MDTEIKPNPIACQISQQVANTFVKELVRDVPTRYSVEVQPFKMSGKTDLQIVIGEVSVWKWEITNTVGDVMAHGVAVPDGDKINLYAAVG